MASPEKSLSKSKTKKTKSKSKKHKIRHTHIEHGDDGSHVIRHSFDQGGEGEEPVPDSVSGVGDSNGLLSHMQDQFGGQLPAGPGANSAGPSPAAAGPGAPAAPSPQAGM